MFDSFEKRLYFITNGLFDTNKSEPMNRQKMSYEWWSNSKISFINDINNGNFFKFVTSLSILKTYWKQMVKLGFSKG